MSNCTHREHFLEKIQLAVHGMQFYQKTFPEYFVNYDLSAI